MSDLISRSALIEEFEERMQYDNVMCPIIKVLDVLEIVEDAPTVEAKPVVHGNWIYIPGLQPGWRCSNCGSAFTMKYQHNHCPHCGARMVKDNE